MYENSKPKQYATVTYLVTMRVGPEEGTTYASDDHAQAVLDTFWERYRPELGKSFRVTHGDLDGNTVRLLCSYSARGANANDVRRRVEATVKRAWREVTEGPTVVRVDDRCR